MFRQIGSSNPKNIYFVFRRKLETGDTHPIRKISGLLALQVIYINEKGCKNVRQGCFTKFAFCVCRFCFRLYVLLPVLKECWKISELEQTSVPHMMLEFKLKMAIFNWFLFFKMFHRFNLIIIIIILI